MPRWRLLLVVACLPLLAGCEQAAREWREHWREPFKIPSRSMSPTLLAGDWFFVDKHAYRVREPRRGEVVVYDAGKERRVSRTVGLPGDRVEVRDGALLLNGEPVPEQATSERFALQPGQDVPVARQSLGDVTFRITRDPGRPERGIEAQVLAPDHYLLLSDFRNGALDGHFEGAVARSALVGPVTTIYFSLDPAGGGVRWSRIGHGVNAS